METIQKFGLIVKTVKDNPGLRLVDYEDLIGIEKSTLWRYLKAGEKQEFFNSVTGKRWYPGKIFHR